MSSKWDQYQVAAPNKWQQYATPNKWEQYAAQATNNIDPVVAQIPGMEEALPSKSKTQAPKRDFIDTQIRDMEATAQAATSILSSGMLAIPGALQALGNWILTADSEQAKKGMEEWMAKAYMPSNDLATSAIETIGQAYEKLASATEEQYGTGARMASEIGLVLAPGAKALRPKTLAETKAHYAKLNAKKNSRIGVDLDIIDSADIRLQKYAPEIAGGMRKMEAEGMRLGVEFDSVVSPLVESIKGIKKEFPEIYRRMEDAYFDQLNPDRRVASGAISRMKKELISVLGKDRALELFVPVENALRARGKALKEVAPKTEMVRGYLPLRIIHPEKFKANLRGPIGDKLAKINTKLEEGKIDLYTAERQRTRALTEGITVDVLGRKSKHEKTRRHRKLSDKQKEAYASFEDALANYFIDTGKSIAERRFLGKGDSYKEAIGHFMDKHATHKSAGEIRKVLEARFGPNARKGMDKGWNNVKELGYLGTIADFASAVVQLGDTAVAFARQGALNAGKAVYQSAGSKLSRRRKGAVEPEAVGQIDIMHEMATAKGGTNILLDRMLSYSGFKTVDKFGKRAVLTAARNRLMKQASTHKGYQQLKIDYGWMGEAFDQFAKDLKTGDVKNKNVQFALVNELMDVQPITLMQMPLTYLRNPNGRIFYALKTWAIRQINRYREDVIKGNGDRALKHAAAVYLATESIDLAKDTLSAAITGKELTMEEVGDEAINNMLRMLFLSSYSMGKVININEDGDISVPGRVAEATAAATGVIPAAAGVVGDVMSGVWEALSEGEIPTRAIKRIPIVGRSVAGAIGEE